MALYTLRTHAALSVTVGRGPLTQETLFICLLDTATFQRMSVPHHKSLNKFMFSGGNR